ncbi:MAG: hypothetical protein A3F93_03115 [Candidatus Magasanikbacteria bacterium RIFCSPLOWO2_12_FULL_34_7]|nr:MAG: hypothetical protein A3F93_03115 [Candidatus Magasanikbacteria bacterium RIFCSPLOWO2_12_FULL_34_7]
MEEQKEEALSKTNKNEQVKWKFFLMGIAVIVVLIGIFGVVYTVIAVRNLSTSPTVLKVAEVLNLPVLRVNGSAIPYVTYMDDLSTLNEFYSKAPEGAVPPSGEAVSDQVLSRLIVNSLIKDIARENQLTVTEEDIQKLKDEIFAQYASEAEVEVELQEQYGWDMATYIEKIIKPLVTEQKVSEAFEAGEINVGDEVYQLTDEVRASHILFRTDEEGVDLDDVKKNAEEVLARAKSGEDFASLATEFGSDATKEVGGDLGWFGQGMMVPEFEGPAFSTPVGQVNDQLVETQFGYHIIKVTDKRSVRNFGEYLDNRINDAKIEILIDKVHDPLEEYRRLQALNNTTQENSAQDVIVEEVV